MILNHHIFRGLIKVIIIGVLLNLMPFTHVAEAEEPDKEAKWWKGNLHTHTLWSDGDDYPDMVVKSYRDNNYNFLVLTDHNVFQDREVWTDPESNKGGVRAMMKYLETFGKAVDSRTSNGKTEIRLKTFKEMSEHFDRDQEFLLIGGEEVTARHLTAPIHLNASNIDRVIPPATGDSVADVMQKNVDLIKAYRKESGKEVLIHINHPNFGWGITAEELMGIRGENFFEVYNGHPSVNNNGDKVHASTERMWDIILTWRLGILNMPVMYGLATDDSHSYHARSPKLSNTFRGWVMVRAGELHPDAIIRAIHQGQFYASSGVEMDQLSWSPDKPLFLKPKAAEGETFTFTFIGTRKGFDRTNRKIRTASGDALRITHRYSSDVGEVLQKSSGLSATYTPKGDELYVRCLIESNQLMQYPLAQGETRKAWIQPIIPTQQ